MKKSHLVGVAIGIGAVVLGATARDARACGGCMTPPPGVNENPSVVTDHRMILSISSAQTTLYDQIRYAGNPSSFAWVLPISGQVTVGISSDVVFGAIDQLTRTDVISPPPPNCPGPPYQYCPNDCHGFGGAESDASAGDGGAAPPPPVVVTTQQTVGPYETVQLHSTDPSALASWLTSHGYAIPADVQPIIDAYVAAQFDFLAMKLVPGAGIQSMRPVRVTMAGATTVLPLRMVAAGTGATVGVTLWTVGDGRYQPQNFPWFTIDPNELVWNFATESSNYSVLRAQKEAASAGRGWQIESSIAGVLPALETLVTQRPAGVDYDPATNADGGVVEGADSVRQDDLRALAGGTSTSLARVTRMRSDLARAALATDLNLEAAQDQSVLSNIVRVTNAVNVPICPTYPPPPPCPSTPPPCPPPYYGDGGVNGQDPNGANGLRGTNGNTAESFSCATTPGDSSPEALASLLVLVGVVGARMRRRPRS